MHRIDNSKDPNFWSARVNRDVRLIVHKTDQSLLVAYVDHHDAAYAWAERRRIEAHPRTGAIQIVEIRERVEDVAPPATFDFVFPEPVKGKEKLKPAAAALFASLDDDALLSIGVPAIGSPTSARPAKTAFLHWRLISQPKPPRRCSNLPPPAGWWRLRRRRPSPIHSSIPMRCGGFRLIADQEELEQALAFPWEKWGVFLHPSQRALVERSFSGPARVAGSAGTGKTIVAIHRAVRLARDNPSPQDLAREFLAAPGRRHGEEAAGAGARDRRHRSPDHHGVVPGHRRADVPARARRAPAHRVRRRAARAAARRRCRHRAQGLFGALPAVRVDQRHRRLGPDVARRLFDGPANGPQEQAWPQSARPPVASVRSGTRGAGGGTLHDLGGRLYRPGESACSGRPTKPFDHVIIDEAQDLAPAELRFFAALAPAGVDGLFLSGDVGQRIFQHPFSWASLGVDVRGRSHTLKVCYRTSQQIRRAADRLLPTVLRDTDGLEDERRGIISVFDGPSPEVKSFPTVAAEADAVRQRSRDLARRGYRSPRNRPVCPNAAACRARTRRDRRAGGRRRDDDRTMSLAKGLEFRAVVVMACDEGVLPLDERVADAADEAELDDIYETERRLLYVACTRAREHLLLTGVAPVSEYLADLQAKPG